MTGTPQTAEAAVPERQQLELSFVRARWLVAGGIAVIAPLGGVALWAAVAVVAALVAGNLVVRRVNRGVASLAAQRRLGVAAVVLDTAAVFGLALAAPAGVVNAIYAALFIVVAEAAMRFAPAKALGAALALAAGLTVTMGLRTAFMDDPFNAPLLGVLVVLVLLAGMMIGSVVREIYRHQVGPTQAPSASGTAQSNVPQDALALLTPRERQVMSLIAQGYSNTQIAAALVVEQKTVKNHINNIYGKLRLNSRYEAITHMLGQREAGSDTSIWRPPAR